MNLKTQVASVLRKAGYELRSLTNMPRDFDHGVGPIVEKARPYSMTRMESLNSIVQAVRYLHRNGVPGAIVECGVYMGGCMLTAALTLDSVGDHDRDLYLFDTFEGMTPPTDEDGAMARQLFHMDGTKQSIACRSPLDQVTGVMALSEYPKEKVHFVKGPVEQTVPGSAPERIALLRLDTDWYQSTKHDLIHLFPRLVSGGVLIIDDYGDWEGARRACDEYFEEHKVPILLHRIDSSVRCAIKL